MNKQLSSRLTTLCDQHNSMQQACDLFIKNFINLFQPLLPIQEARDLFIKNFVNLSGATIRYLGGGGGLHGAFASTFFLCQKGDGKLYFPPQDRLYFHHALWPFIYFTHFPHISIYFQKAPGPLPVF